MDSWRFERIPHLLSRDVEVWRVDLDAYPQVGLAEGLTADEVARASRQADEQDGRRLLAARHALRCIVGQAIGTAAGSLVFEVDEFGKPRLAGTGMLEFNLSHSGRECVIGTSPAGPIGVDIEVIRPVDDAEALARLHFTSREQAEWAAVRPVDRHRAFLACWTRKEACVKALGIGLSAPPALIDAGGGEGCRSILVQMPGGSGEVTVSSLRLPTSAAAAVALTDRQSVAAARARFTRN